MRAINYTYTTGQNLATINNPLTPDGFPEIKIMTTDYKLAGAQQDID
jgi:hypothetical protein